MVLFFKAMALRYFSINGILTVVIKITTWYLMNSTHQSDFLHNFQYTRDRC